MIAASVAAARHGIASEYDVQLGKLASALRDDVGATRLTVAVLDFTDTHGRPQERGAQLARDLATELSHGGPLRFIERVKVEAARARVLPSESAAMTEQQALDVGTAAGADAVLLGELSPMKDTLSVNVAIVRVATGAIVATRRASFPLDVFGPLAIAPEPPPEASRLASTPGSPPPAAPAPPPPSPREPVPPTAEKAAPSHHCHDLDVERLSVAVGKRGPILELAFTNRGNASVAVGEADGRRTYAFATEGVKLSCRSITYQGGTASGETISAAPGERVVATIDFDGEPKIDWLTLYWDLGGGDQCVLEGIDMTVPRPRKR
ncbi:MAG: hypothetical protein U0166_05720 [Acidobacteriota bacterium]